MNPEILTTKAEFWKLYWFSPLQMVTLINPKEEDYRFMVEMRNFVIGAGKTEQMPGTVANVYLDQMTRILAQDEDKLEFLSDHNLMRQYYDRLIVTVTSMVQEVDNTPAYLQQVPDTMKAADPETPPWQQPKSFEPEPAPVQPSGMRDTLSKEDIDKSPNKPAPEKEEVKEFEYKGDKFKMVVAKTGKSMFYKNGALTTETEYARVASML